MRKTTLRELTRFSALKFESWLSTRLSDAYRVSERPPNSAQIFRDLEISSRSILNALSSLFSLLPLERQPRFHEAIGNLLRHARVGRFPEQAMKELIMLLATTRAFQQLTSLDAVLGCGEWGDACPGLFGTAMSALRTLRTAREAYGACHRLITAPRFPLVYVFDAYEVLIACLPERWVADLLDLSPLMLRLLQNIRQANDSAQEADYEKRFAHMMGRLMDTVSAWQISEGLRELTQHGQYLTPVHPVGRTLDFLASGVAENRIVVDPKSGRLVLRSKRSATERVVFGVSGPGELYLLNACREESLAAMRASLAEDIKRDVEGQGQHRDIEALRALERANQGLSHLSAPSKSETHEGAPTHG